MISHVNLEKYFRDEAVLTATYLINLTPFEFWHDKKLKLKYLRVFGSTIYIHNKTRKTNFNDKSLRRILLGYEPTGYKVRLMETE